MHSPFHTDGENPIIVWITLSEREMLILDARNTFYSNMIKKIPTYDWGKNMDIWLSWTE